MEEGLSRFVFRCYLQRCHMLLLQAILKDCGSYTAHGELVGAPKACPEAALGRCLIFTFDETVVDRFIGRKRSGLAIMTTYYVEYSRVRAGS